MDSSRGLAASIAALALVVATALTLLVVTGAPLDFRDWPSSPEPKVGPEERGGVGENARDRPHGPPALVALDASAPSLGADGAPGGAAVMSPRRRSGRRRFSRGRRRPSAPGGTSPQPKAPAPQTPAPQAPTPTPVSAPTPISAPTPVREPATARPGGPSREQEWEQAPEQQPTVKAREPHPKRAPRPASGPRPRPGEQGAPARGRERPGEDEDKADSRAGKTKGGRRGEPG